MQTSQSVPGPAQALAAPQIQPATGQTFPQQQYLQQPAQPQQPSQPVAVAMQIPQAPMTGATFPAAAAQPPSQPQQGFPHQGLNGGWQSDKDYQERRKMIGKIVLLLQQRKPNAPQEWLKKLPQMAKRLEESLYRSAKSFAEYNDANTLKQRLQQLAVNIGMKTKKIQQQAQIMQHQKQLQQQVQQQQQQQQLQPQFVQQVAAQPQQQPLLPAQSQVAAPVQQVVQQPVQAAPPPRMVNMADINPMIAAPAPQPVVAQQQQPIQQIQYVAQAQPVQAQPAAAAAAPAVPGAPATDANGNRQVSDRQQVLRHQQQRLLLLRHAAKCQHEDNRCPVTPHCAGMKRLWKHIAECKNQKCLVPHCVSSRYVLSHYHRCKDVRCPVCGPVREAIHRSHEKQKHMQVLKQRHQQAVQQTGPAGAAQPGAALPGAPAVSSGIPSTISMEPANKRQKTELPNAQGLPRPLGPTSAVGMAQAHPGAAMAGVSVPGIPGKPTVAAVPGLAFSNGQVIMPKTVGPKPQEDHTLINCFSVDQIELHIASLNNGLVLSPLKLKTKATEVLKAIQAHQHAWVFNTPVDPVELGLPDYFQVIKHPMDLGTVRKKLENGIYIKIEHFESHVNLTFDNAMLYNPEGSVVYNMAKEMKTQFAHDFAKLMTQLNAEESVKRQNGEACLLCGCEKLLFEPPVFYCNGLNCPSKRIRRNSYYYVAGSNQYHWCHQCFQEIRDNTTLDLGDLSIKKESLVKKKNDEVHEESWVQCDRCERWVHQICALFNTRQNKDQRSEYACPRCTIDERRQNGNLEATSTTPMAEDLPRTLLSEYLENHVRVKVDEFIEKQSAEKSVKEQIPIEEARKKLQMGGDITIRQVTSMDRKLEVRERMKARYAFKNYPDEFSFRCKCIVVFQNLDGVDVMLFGLYVYEHDDKNPAPNTNTVYISYLDSVHYMRPRQMRTFIYHEILISYLDYVRRRGFATAHIWACPPLKGDDYILYAKPEDQKVPKDDRLRQWYIDMLIEAQRRGIVGLLTNMYDLYFSDPKFDATAVPYMDGDYFPAEVENIIKDIEDGKSGKKSSTKNNKDGNDKAKQKKKNNAGRQGTRSAGLDEDALRASGMVPNGSDARSLEEGARDYVMVKLGETIQPMKESFIVAYLATKGASEEIMVVPKDIQDYRDAHNITWKIENDSSEPSSVAEGVQKEVEPPVAESSVVDGGVADVPSTVVAEVPTSTPLAGDAMDTTEPAPIKIENTTSDAVASDGPKPAPVVPDSTESAMNGVVSATSAPTDMEVTPVAASAPVKTEDTTAPMMESTEVEAATSYADPATEEKKEMETSAVPSTLPSEPAPAEAPALSEVTNDQPASADTSFLNIPMPEAPQPAEVSSVAGATSDANLVIREGKFAAMEARKRTLDGDVKEEEPKAEEVESKEKSVSKSIFVKDSKGRVVKVLDDDEEELDCEFLNNRQAFLNLCQGNHYQFDFIRRAKHSSMMVLWHLHNRDAPKFVQQCATCSREILAGYRLHCPICADFDQCQDCYSNPTIARHPHPLKPVAITSAQQNELTDAQRKERQRSIQLHMTLLLHAATCNSTECPSANCTKMKGLLKHGAQCQIKAAGGCNVCKRIWALLQIHARQCKTKICRVPNCMAIRERVRQLKKQQQAMDDRRRQEMNRAYRGKR